MTKLRPFSALREILKESSQPKQSFPFRLSVILEAIHPVIDPPNDAESTLINMIGGSKKLL